MDFEIDDLGSAGRVGGCKPNPPLLQPTTKEAKTLCANAAPQRHVEKHVLLYLAGVFSGPRFINGRNKTGD